jgi:FkbM family methyltransferase
MVRLQKNGGALLLPAICVGMLFLNSFLWLPAGCQDNMDTIYLRKNDVSNIADSKLVRNAGEGWKVPDWKKDIASIKRDLERDDNFKCEWTTFKSSATGNTAEMCVHPFGEAVSETIKAAHHFHHCDALSAYWNENVNDANAVYLEVGANIGSCVMEMLLGTNANIIAFEPHPMNVFVLKQTISKLNFTLQDRVRLVPVGLGHEQASTTIYAAGNNMGNSIVGMIVKDNRKQEFGESLQFKVPIERLDSIVKSDTNVKLMKMDAQGYECNIMEGMGQALASGIETLKFEWAPKHLNAQKCTTLLDRMRAYGFDIYRDVGKGGKFANPMAVAESNPSRMTDLYANRQNK